MRKTAIIPAWARILRGFRPFLSIEITKEYPLRCPGCYAYEPGHLSDGRSIASLTEWRGEELVDRVLELVRRFRPLHVSIVGGEPLIRYRELTCLIREFDTRGIEVQVVTSAVRPIPAEWTEFASLHLVVSVDGLQPEHDARRTPATYDRILRHIDGHQIIVHCTIVPQFLARVDYLRDFPLLVAPSRRSEDSDTFTNPASLNLPIEACKLAERRRSRTRREKCESCTDAVAGRDVVGQWRYVISRGCSA